MLRQLQRKSFCSDRSSMQKKWRRYPPSFHYLMLPLPHFFCTAFVYVFLSETCRSLTKTASQSWAGLAAHANRHEFFISSHASPRNAASTPPATAASGGGMCDDELQALVQEPCRVDVLRCSTLVHTKGFEHSNKVFVKQRRLFEAQETMAEGLLQAGAS
jgi:hypothetical protein